MTETAALLRAKAWSETPLGPIEQWPNSLRVAVNICLSSRFPMFVWWGDELINIYNDAYAPVLGKRHPHAFGASAPTVWQEIWHVVGPQAEAVMQRGEATWNERVLLVMERNGYTEDTYFTWSYSPIYDEAGVIRGVFCACSEETSSVVAERERDRLIERLDGERSRLASLFTQSPAFMAVLRGPSFVFELVNERYYLLVGRRDLIGKPVRDAIPEMEGQLLLAALQHTYASGEAFVGTSIRAVLRAAPDQPLREAYIDVVYQPLRRGDGTIEAVLCHGIDVTERKRSEERDQFLLALDEAVRGLDLPEVITAACARLLGEHLEANRCAYADVEADQDTFNLTGNYARDTSDAVGRYRFSWFGADVLEAMHEGRPYVIDDVARNSAESRDVAAIRHLEIRAVVCFPLLKAGRFVAAMAVHQKTPRRWTDSEIELIGYVANRCYEAIERARVGRELRISEARFRAAVSAMSGILWTNDPSGKMAGDQPYWAAFTGQSHEQYHGYGWSDAVHPDDAAATVRAWEEVVAKNEMFVYEHRLRRSDGEYRHCSIRAVPVFDARGQVREWVGVHTDITEQRRYEQERKRMNDALGAEKRVLELIATGSPLSEVLEAIARGVERQSADGVLCAIFMLEETGKQLVLGAAPSLPPEYLAAVDGTVIGPRAASCGTAAYERRSVVVEDIASDDRWQEHAQAAERAGLRACSATPILAGDGRVLGTVAVYYRQPHRPSAHDMELLRSANHLAGIILEKQQVDRRLSESFEAEQQARSEAERASRMKDEFLASLSHELRTPLNAILGWSQVIRIKQNVPPELLKGIAVIERNARAQARIVEDLLDMSAIISGKVRLEVRRVDVNSVVLAAVDTARPTADSKHVQLECTLREGDEFYVRGDANRLQQVLWNLISNAVKFTHAGGRVEVCVTRVDGHVEVAVRDTGEGIMPDFLPFVFDRFRQADASSTRRHGGLGLGLSIVKQLVELHGGTVRVQSEGLGQGATFTFQLPLMVNGYEPTAALRTEHPGPVDEGAEKSEETPAIAGLEVLVVDDEPDARELVKRLLEDCSAAVTTAASAEEAVQLVRNKRFDILVSDLGMPGEDGHSLIRRVRSLGRERGGDVPAVALTAYVRPEDRLKALRAGFQVHVSKPVEPAELIATVASLARRA